MNSGRIFTEFKRLILLVCTDETISTTFDLNSCWRKPFIVDLTDISKREFTLAILFCLNYALLTTYEVNNVQLFRDSKPIRLFETTRSLSEYILILKTINKIVYFNRPHPRNNPVDLESAFFNWSLWSVVYIVIRVRGIRLLFCPPIRDCVDLNLTLGFSLGNMVYSVIEVDSCRLRATSLSVKHHPREIKLLLIPF